MRSSLHPACLRQLRAGGHVLAGEGVQAGELRGHAVARGAQGRQARRPLLRALPAGASRLQELVRQRPQLPARPHQLQPLLLQGRVEQQPQPLRLLQQRSLKAGGGYVCPGPAARRGCLNCLQAGQQRGCVGAGAGAGRSRCRLGAQQRQQRIVPQVAVPQLVHDGLRTCAWG